MVETEQKEQNYSVPAERQNLILEQIKIRKAVSVNDLAKRFFINEATIRRDLNLLEKTGLISRTYGGAVLVEGLDNEIPLFVRETENKEAKELIGKTAAQFVYDGDTVILDSSSTTMCMIPFLEQKKGLKIITNGAKTAILLSKLADCKIYCTGGVLRENSLSFIGSAANEFIRNLYADKAFFSCRGMSLEKGLTDSNEEEAVLRRLIIKNSGQKFLLLNSSKFDTSAIFKISDVNELDQIITEKIPGILWREALKNRLIIN